MEARGLQVTRESTFVECSKAAENTKINIVYEDQAAKKTILIKSDYLVGCDGARSKVRPFIPSTKLEGEMTNASWGVLDGMRFLLRQKERDSSTDAPQVSSRPTSRTYGARRRYDRTTACRSCGFPGSAT